MTNLAPSLPVQSGGSMSTVDLSDSPVDSTTSFVSPHLPVPSSSSASASSSSLNRQSSSSSARSGRIPSPRLASAMPPPSAPVSSSSSASGSKSGSFISTPKLLSRKSSVREKQSSGISLGRKGSVKGKDKEEGDGWKSPLSESGSVEVIETPLLKVQNDPESGRKMINQYLVLDLIGSGAHGKVRKGRDMSELPGGEEEGELGTGQEYAIKIVERNPKRKRLTGFSKQKGLLGKSTKSDGGKLVNESEIRKEIAIFKKVNHPNVVRMKEIIDDPESSRIFMVLEYCDGGEVIWKGENGPALTIAETRAIFRDTVLGLEYLHHQGIIHRDIKPSNLLFSNGTVKISDFGCSHYSEALREASATGDCDEYIDDVELAKTAGSPAFFAPEMCYSSLDNELSPTSSRSTNRTPVQELPGFTLRPPSYIDENHEHNRPELIPLKPTTSAESRRSDSVRSSSPVVRQRLPITNAIDVWALGVTLYCLFFGRTPFDAPNEYLLMQIIPIADYEIPSTIGRDRLPTSGVNQEANECLDILRRLLEKSPAKRISLEQAKKHPFTLRGMSDPSSWLASTDPHVQSFVTVSNDEVAAVIKRGKFRDRLKKSILSIGHKLQLLSSTGRSRSRSIGDTDRSGNTSTYASMPSSALPSQINVESTSSPKAKPRGVAASPLPSPAPTMSRRFSLLSTKLERVPSPAAVSLPSSTPHLGSPAVQTKSVPTDIPGFQVYRPQTAHLAPPAKPAMIPLVDETPRSPRQVASSSSLDKYKMALPESTSVSPASSLRRRQSSDIDVAGRQRSTSNASSGGLGSKLVRLLSRNNSQRSSRFRRKAPSVSASSDFDDSAIVSTSTSPPEEIGRMSLEDGGRTRQSLDTEVYESSSYSSSTGIPQRVGGGGMHLPLHSSSDRLERLNTWDSRYSGLRRGSGLSETFTRATGAVDEEEVDWDGALSDDDDYGEPRPLPRSSHFPLGLDRGLGLDVEPSVNVAGVNSSIAQPVSTVPNLDPIPDISPNSLISTSKPKPKLNLSPTHSTFINDFHPQLNDFHPKPHPYPRSPSRTRGSPSPYRSGSGNGPERTRSPLGHREGDETSGIPIPPAASPVASTSGRPGRGSPMRHGPGALALGRTASYSVLGEEVIEADEEEDQGLAISLNGKRGRKASVLSRKTASEDEIVR